MPKGKAEKLRKGRNETIIYETLEEITEAIAKNCDLHDAKLIDMRLGSDRKVAEFTLELNGHLFDFHFIDLLEYSIYCDDMINPYTFEVTVDKTKDGYVTVFDGLSMTFKSKNIELKII